MSEMERNIGNSRCQDKREGEEESMRKQGQEEFYDKFIKIQIFMKRRLKIQRGERSKGALPREKD